MPSARKSRSIIWGTILLVALGAWVFRGQLAIEYHKNAFERAEIKLVRTSQGELGFSDRCRAAFGLPATDYASQMSYYGQQLIGAGVLVRRDIRLEHELDMALFTTNVHRDIGGRFSQVWRGSNCVSVVAQPDRIDAFIGWIIDQDSKRP